MVSRGFPGFVTGYSHLVDVVVRRGRYLQPRGGTHSFRYQVEFCSKERGNEKTSCTYVMDVPRFWNRTYPYAEKHRSATCQGGSPCEAPSGHEGCQVRSSHLSSARRAS